MNREGKEAFGCGYSIEEILQAGSSPRPFEWSKYTYWQVDGVLFGHFLSPTSEDAALGCFQCHSHPALWGATLLLTKRSGRWMPVWYKPGIVTHHCRRVGLVSGRQILLCEEIDGGMGHALHGVYVVDFTKPEFAWDSVVLMADSYGSFLLEGVQRQRIERVVFDRSAEGGGLLLRVFAWHGFVPLRLEDQDRYVGGVLPKPKVRRYEIDFRLVGKRFQVTRRTMGARKLFKYY